MILLENERLGCENCIRGHRAADCQHLRKHLISIKGRGRPAAKDESIRYRVNPEPKVIKTSWEPIESKNGRGKSGTTKFCYHLDPNTPVELYKVKLGKGFKVIGPVTDYKYQNSFRVRSNVDSHQYIAASVPSTPAYYPTNSAPLPDSVSNSADLHPTATSASFIPDAIALQLANFQHPVSVREDSLSPAIPFDENNYSSNYFNGVARMTPAPSPDHDINSKRASPRVGGDVFDNSRPSVSSMSSISSAGSDLNLQSLHIQPQTHLQQTQYMHPVIQPYDTTFLQMHGIFDPGQVFRYSQQQQQQQQQQQPSDDSTIRYQEVHDLSSAQYAVLASGNTESTFQGDQYSGQIGEVVADSAAEEQSHQYTQEDASAAFFQQFLNDASHDTTQWPSGYGYGNQ